MNTIDNGISEVVSVERIITDTKLCFKVTFKDWHGVIRENEYLIHYDYTRKQNRLVTFEDMSQHILGIKAYQR